MVNNSWLEKICKWLNYKQLELCVWLCLCTFLLELVHQLVMPRWWSNDNGWKIIKSFSCSLSRWFQSLGTPKKCELKYYICTWFIKFKQISKDVFSIFNTLYLNVASTIINFYYYFSDVNRISNANRSCKDKPKHRHKPKLKLADSKN